METERDAEAGDGEGAVMTAVVTAVDDDRDSDDARGRDDWNGGMEVRRLPPSLLAPLNSAVCVRLMSLASSVPSVSRSFDEPTGPSRRLRSRRSPSRTLSPLEICAPGRYLSPVEARGVSTPVGVHACEGDRRSSIVSAKSKARWLRGLPHGVARLSGDGDGAGEGGTNSDDAPPPAAVEAEGIVVSSGEMK